MVCWCVCACRYLSDVLHRHVQHGLADFNEKLQLPIANLSDVILQNADTPYWMNVPDNYMTRYLAGTSKTSLFEWVSQPATHHMYERALANLDRMDVVLVLERAQEPGVDLLLRAFGLPPFSEATREGTRVSSLPSAYNLTKPAQALLDERHKYDWLLYQRALQRQKQITTAFNELKREGLLPKLLTHYSLENVVPLD